MKTVVALALLASLAAGCGGGRADGWHVGSHGIYRWASTVRFRDCAQCVPPHRTLAALPPSGVIVQETTIRVRAGHDTGSGSPRIRAGDVQPGFEGVPRRQGVSQLVVRKGTTEHAFFVWFGRAAPTPGQLARANAELARLSS